MKSQVCRYCRTRFTPKADKPGYPDECAVCLHTKTAPKKLIKELTKALKKLDREMEKVTAEIKKGRIQDARKARKQK